MVGWGINPRICIANPIGGALYNPENERFIFAGKIPLNSHKHAIFCKQNEGQGWFKLH